jgi:hypothetical protein
MTIYVVDHRQPLVPQLAEAAPRGVDYVFSTTATDRNLAAYAEVLNPFGQIETMQHHILTQVARLADAGILTTTATHKGPVPGGPAPSDLLSEARRLAASSPRWWLWTGTVSGYCWSCSDRIRRRGL